MSLPETSSLTYAVTKGNTAAVEIALAKGDDPCIVDKKYLNTPYSLAIRIHGPNSEIAKLLRQQDTNQDLIITNLKKYLLFRDDEDVTNKTLLNKLKNSEILETHLSFIGYCLGLSTLWAFAHFLEHQPKTDEHQLRDDFTWFKSTAEFICDLDNRLIQNLKLTQAQQDILKKINSNIETTEIDSVKKELLDSFNLEQQKQFQEISEKIDRFLLYMSYAQIYLNLNRWHGITKLSLTKGEVYKLEPYSVRTKKENLKKYIVKFFPNNLLGDVNNAVVIGSNNHAICVTCNDNYWICYDPNNESMEIKIPINDTETLLDFIWRIMHFEKEKDSPICFIPLIYSEHQTKDEKEEIKEIKEIENKYPKHEEFINALESSATYDPDYAEGYTALHNAAKTGTTKSAEILIEKHKSAEILIEKHKNDPIYINQADKDGFTPLHFAAQNGHTEIVKLLLENGADPNQCTKNGNTPLRLAIQNRHPDIVEILYKTVNPQGQTPLHFAAQNGHADVVKILLEKNIDPNQIDKNGQTPLHFAAKNGNTKIVNLFLQQKYIDPNQVNNKGKTPLHYAAQNGHTDVAFALLQNDADPNQTDKNGQIPLHFAVQNEHTETVKLLLQNGTYINKKDKHGKTSLDIAKEKNNVEIINMLNCAIKLSEAFNALKKSPTFFSPYPEKTALNLFCEAQKIHKDFFESYLEKKVTTLTTMEKQQFTNLINKTYETNACFEEREVLEKLTKMVS